MSGEIVRRYLDAVASSDWSAAEACLAPEVVRVGPFGDTYSGREPYLDFLREVMPTLPGYAMAIRRVVAADSVVIVELSEAITIDDTKTVTEECLVFDLDGAGCVIHIAIYIQRLPGARGTP